ncbi:MAG TPA: tyrosinase family protein [Silvibacterium sp.]|nr:tyrosinase family protein [Silvibacterium sp.]
MTFTPRRTFLKQAAATAMLPLISKAITGCTNPFPRVRYNVLSAPGQAMIRKYARAVQIMKSRPAYDPSSWTFWWYTHAIPVSKSAAIQQVFGEASSTAKDLAQKAWWTCQPHQVGEHTDNFLPWHRMLVYFFEKQIGAVLHDDSFTMPYWNSTPGLPSSQSGILPLAFRSPDDPFLAPLHIQDRNNGVNSGVPIDIKNPGVLSAASAMAETTYSPNSPKQGFCNNINVGVHAYVHALVGTVTNMGFVPTSAQDPVFWMLHSNIDRLWASWNRAGNLNPTDPDFLSQVFWFADPDGRATSIKFGDAMSIAQLNYTYEEFEPVPSQFDHGPSPSLRDLPPGTPLSTTLVASATAVSLDSKVTTVQIKSTHDARSVFDLSLTMPPAPDLGAYYLVIRDLQVNVQPGIVYSLYLDISGSASDETLQAHKVGDLNFFQAMPGMEMNEPNRFVSYDITELANRLGTSAFGNGVSLTIIPSGEPAAGSEPVIGSITIERV